MITKMLPLVVLMTIVCASDAVRTQQPVTRALLIGVSSYPNLDDRAQLTGPANDVALVRDTLLGAPFNIAAARITALVETAAGAKNPARPTHANIEREFARLAKEANKGDQVFILFAGHGSQQPDDNGDEDDGRDEIFLPADAGKWTGSLGRVENAISDDEIGKWLTAIRSRGAFVSVVFDACQSTSMTRGSIEVMRFVSPVDLGIPADVLAKAQGAARGDAAENAIVGLSPQTGDIVALYAAQTIEPTPEKVLPDGKGEKDAKVHGLFTYTLVSALKQAQGRLTYRDLVERVIQHYRAMGRIGPTPGFEGGGLDREVLGQKDFAGTTRLVLGAKKETGIEVRAGAVHALTNGSILRVYPINAAQGAKPVGHVKLSDVDVTSSIAAPVEYGGLRAPDPKLLAEGSRAEVAYYHYGDEVFRVALYADPKTPPPPDVSKRLEDALAAVEKETNGRAARSASVAEANWLVRVMPSGEIVVAPASGWRIDPARKESDDAQAPFLIHDTKSMTLESELARVVAAVGRARNLSKLSVAPENKQGDVNIDVELVRYKDRQDTVGAVVPVNAGTRTLRVGEQIAFRFKNTGSTSADVTLLFVDADYGITALYPRENQEADARIPAGEERRTGRINVTPPTGWEQIVAIAVEAGSVRQDFRALEQPPLTRISAQTRSGAAPEKPRGLPESPLGHLLNGAVRGQGATRGAQNADVGKYSLKMIAWRTEAAPKP